MKRVFLVPAPGFAARYLALPKTRARPTVCILPRETMERAPENSITESAAAGLLAQPGLSQRALPGLKAGP